MSEEATANLQPFTFTGKGGEFFKIWIVNILLTILTLGIYSAWAKVRTKRYFYGNTHFDDANFEYHATPIQILKGRIIAIAVLIIVGVVNELYPLAGLVTTVLLMLIAPFVIWSALRFNAKMSSYRNVKFSFTGELKDIYKYLILVPLMPIALLSALGYIFHSMGATPDALSGLVFVGIISVYLFIPFVQALFQYYYVNGSRYGQGKFKGKITASFFYKTYLKLFGLSILFSFVIGIIGAILGIVFGVLGSAVNTDIFSSPDAMKAILPIIFVAYLPFILMSIFFKAYLHVRIRNYTLNQTRLDKTLSFKSDLSVSTLFKMQVVNLLLLIFTLGFAYPWVLVRLARYSAESLQGDVHADLSQYVVLQQQKQSALAEEMGDAFDMDADVGLTL